MVKKKDSKSIQIAFKDHSESIQRAFKEHSEIVKRSIKEPPRRVILPELKILDHLLTSISGFINIKSPKI